MKKTQDKSNSPAVLRKKAEASLKKTQPKTAPELSKLDALKLIHELQVHQIELEMQNDELQKNKQELEIAKTKYLELFDQAPVGYFMLNENLIILEINHKAASYLSYTRDAMVKKPLSRFIFPSDIVLYNLRVKKLLLNKEYQEFEIGLQKKDGMELCVTMRLVPLHDGIDKPLYIATISDISRVKNLEKEVLDAKREEFKVIFDNVADGILIADLATKKLYRGNDAICKMLGYSPSEIRHLSVFDIHPEKDIPYIIGEFERQAKGEISLSLDLPVKRIDGTVFYADVNARKMIIDGKPYLMGLFRDTTERKKAEIAIKESEQRFMNIFYASEDAILLIDRETFVDCNEATVRMLGYARKEELLMSHPSVLSPPTQPDGRVSFEKANEMMDTAYNKGFNRFVWMHRKANGEDFPVEVSLTPIVMKGKNILHCLWRDISEIRKLEQEKERLADIIETSPNFVGLANAKDNHVIYVNKAGRQMCGLGNDEDITKLRIEDLHPAWANHKLSTEILPAAVRDNSWSGECAFKNIKDNKEIPVLMVLNSHKTPNGEIELFSTISQDISLLRKEQHERLNLEKQLFQSQKIEAIGSLTGSIAHDMNNIFSAISAYTSLFLSEYLKNDTQKDYIQRVHDLGKKGADIVNQIRKFSKPKDLVFEPIDIKPIVEDILKLLHIRLRHIAAISVTIIPKQRLPIMGDATQISQMLLNLISNSCDAMEGKWGKLDITIDEVSFFQNALPLPELKPGRYLKLTIKDTGRGMTSEVKKRIFDTFFTTKGEKGTGLGLSIVKRVISSHNGAISVDSAPDKGTIFHIYFPVISNISDPAIKP